MKRDVPEPDRYGKVANAPVDDFLIYFLRSVLHSTRSHNEGVQRAALSMMCADLLNMEREL